MCPCMVFSNMCPCMGFSNVSMYGVLYHTLMMAGMTLSMVFVMTRKLYMSSFLATLAPMKVKMDMMLCNTRPYREGEMSCDQPVMWRGRGIVIKNKLTCTHMYRHMYTLTHAHTHSQETQWLHSLGAGGRGCGSGDCSTPEHTAPPAPH